MQELTQQRAPNQFVVETKAILRALKGGKMSKKKNAKPVETSIWRLGVNRYYIDVDLRGGNRKRKTVKGDIHLARETRNRIHADLLAQKKGSLTSVEAFKSSTYNTVTELLDQYVESHYKNTKRHIEGSGKTIIRELKIFFGKQRPESISGQDIKLFIIDKKSNVTKKEKTWKSSSINTYLATLKAAYNLLEVKNDLVIKYPLLKINKQKKHIIPEEILEIFRTALPNWAKIIMVYKELVPCRCLELYKLKVSQIDLFCRKIDLYADQTKNDSERSLPIPELMLNYFAQIKESGSEWVFPRTETLSDGRTAYFKVGRNSISNLWRVIRKNNDLPNSIVFRLLRHTTISNWLRFTKDAGLVSDLSGASQDTIREYYDVIPIDVKNTAADEFSLQKCRHFVDTLDKIIPFTVKKGVVSA